MESSCINVADSVRLVQQLKIKGFSVTKAPIINTTSQNYFPSSENYFPSIWTVDEYEWEVRIYPSWTSGPSDRPSVILRFQLLSTPRVSNSSVVASLACRLVDPTGKVQPMSEEKSVSTRFTGNPNGQRCFLNNLYLMPRDDLQKFGYLKDDDSLTIQCAITVYKDLPVVPRIPAEDTLTIHVPSSNLYQHLGEILQSETGADVTFLVSGESFAAHKMMLAARSPVFRAQFFGEMKDKCSQRVEIEDMEAAVFKAMLHFIYTDTLPPELEKQHQASSTVMAQHLLVAADRYGVDRLKLMCEAKLSRGITVETAATTLALAQQHSCSQLRTKCVHFIVSTPAVLDAVLATDGYKYLEASCPLVLTELLRSANGRKS